MTVDNPCLNFIWTTADADTACNFVFMYALNSKIHGWWSEVQLIKGVLP